MKYALFWSHEEFIVIFVMELPIFSQVIWLALGLSFFQYQWRRTMQDMGKFTCTTEHNKAWCYVPYTLGASRNVASTFCDTNLYWILWQSGAEILKVNRNSAECLHGAGEFSWRQHGRHEKVGIKTAIMIRCHYGDVTMSSMMSQITSLRIVYSIVYSSEDQRKHQSSASLAFVWGIHRGPVNSPHKWPVTRKCFHLMTSSCDRKCPIK